MYLVEVEDEDELARLDRNYETLFEEELSGWYTDPISFELHTVVIDTGDSPLEDR